MVMMIRTVLIATLLVAPALAQERFQRGSVPWSGKVEPRGGALLKAAMLDRHNAARRDYGVPALGWDDKLVASALMHARYLAATDTFEQDDDENPEGENLYMGTRGAFSYAAMAQLWVDERRYFRPGRFPDVVKSGHWSKVGHYTQIIWPTTQRVGCAMASNVRDDYLVCRYFPSGNYFGTVLR
jgi:uncharacterized protein YkwD